LFVSNITRRGTAGNQRFPERRAPRSEKANAARTTAPLGDDSPATKLPKVLAATDHICPAREELPAAPKIS
jgi:hypothetical protein